MNSAPHLHYIAPGIGFHKLARVHIILAAALVVWLSGQPRMVLAGRANVLALRRYSIYLCAAGLPRFTPFVLVRKFMLDINPMYRSSDRTDQARS